MLTLETMKWRLERMRGEAIPLVQWPGTARVLDVTDTSLDLLVGSTRADYTWERVRITQQRLVQNHELSIAELGGQHDAVGLVSLLAHMQADEVAVNGQTGVIRLVTPEGVPVHQPTAPRGLGCGTGRGARSMGGTPGCTSRPGGPEMGEAPGAVGSGSTVGTFNEWDPLEEIIVGTVQDARVPPWDEIMPAVVHDKPAVGLLQTMGRHALAGRDAQEGRARCGGLRAHPGGRGRQGAPPGALRLGQAAGRAGLAAAELLIRTR